MSQHADHDAWAEERRPRAPGQCPRSTRPLHKQVWLKISVLIFIAVQHFRNQRTDPEPTACNSYLGLHWPASFLWCRESSWARTPQAFCCIWRPCHNRTTRCMTDPTDTPQGRPPRMLSPRSRWAAVSHLYPPRRNIARGRLHVAGFGCGESGAYSSPPVFVWVYCRLQLVRENPVEHPIRGNWSPRDGLMRLMAYGYWNDVRTHLSCNSMYWCNLWVRATMTGCQEPTSFELVKWYCRTTREKRIKIKIRRKTDKSQDLELTPFRKDDRLLLVAMTFTWRIEMTR